MKERGDAVTHSTILDAEKINATTADAAAGTDSQSTTDDLDDSNSRHHAFSDPVAADHWRNIYEKAGYENRHRFDPSFTWSPEEERKLVRKVDLRIMLWAWIMFCALDMHRRNINRAISDNMLEELGKSFIPCDSKLHSCLNRLTSYNYMRTGMNTNDFNYGQTIFLVSFLSAELPSGLISKKLGADRWIPSIIVGWSIVAGSQTFLTNRAGFYAIKAVLGLLMGGFIPDIVLYLTYFYKSNELPTRLAWFWTALSTVNVVGSLLAAGVLQMRGINGWSGWQWLFLLEGIITLIVGVFSFGLMPPGPCQTRNWFRGPQGWFNEREEKIMVNRLLRDDPSKGDMNNRQAVGPKLLWKAVQDWEQWPLCLGGLTTYIPPSPPQNYLSLILRQLGFSVFQANLLVIPSQVMFALNLLFVTWVSRRLQERAIVSSFANIWIFPWMLALVVLPASASPWVRYGILTALLSYPYCHAILVAWNAKNSNAVRTRAVSAALYNMFVQSGNIIASNIYRDDDKPLYKRGNSVLLGITCFNILLMYLVKAFYIWRNRVRDRKWNALTTEEQEQYLINTKDEGQQRLDFRFAL